MSSSIDRFSSRLPEIDLVRHTGRVVRVVGILVESLGPDSSVGDICQLFHRDGKGTVMAQVVGFRDSNVLLMPFGPLTGVGPGSRVVTMGSSLRVAVGMELLGRIVDGLGQPMDDKPPLADPDEYRSVEASPPNPLTRKKIDKVLPVGVKCIDSLLTLGRGQRVGIFAGSGVGKSTLLGMIARNTAADVNVIGLIGERGREVREFIERDLGPEGLKRSVVVVATSDQPALVRVTGALVATTIAEYFRDQGLDVILMMDSVTRFARSQREMGLAAGEPPATRGYTPSVFSRLPVLLERAGPGRKGTITGLYTVLVEGSDMEEPIADAVRGTLDGHVVLTRALAISNHYPAVAVLESVSRLMLDITSSSHQKLAGKLREVLATYNEAEDLINIGAYARGSNPRIDYAIQKIDDVRNFLRQGVYESFGYEETVELLEGIFGE
ncbi:MAG: flagellar protein export ATPase FliI [Candidatus Wallbacteria bacterium HGW-Wallbacteria-1]|uniref:Flagellar protein export ATPase FliI n=1 Tax=Candidatus Wallbacteria bacterium HGW-Wallbacteria-1 TaxID=2013854 RepID=A0A2N1PTG8_9BACT|nr:MAG: flagellar protein export ATPase FliI [Candidatus Wallbacteria bacterium HGW-Wallbacteria-1]